jgi:hypothetical protein
MDDFGTGYSSLSYLSRFPVDILKMDRSFLREGATPETSGLASAVVAIGETLCLDVVAEGIELSEQWTTLRDLGCNRGQGFYFAEPMPIDQTLDALRNWSARLLAAATDGQRGDRPAADLQQIGLVQHLDGSRARLVGHERHLAEQGPFEQAIGVTHQQSLGHALQDQLIEGDGVRVEMQIQKAGHQKPAGRQGRGREGETIHPPRPRLDVEESNGADLLVKTSRTTTQLQTRTFSGETV